MAFRNKTAHILSLKPDLLLVQECEQRVVVEQEHYLENCHGALWHGDNKHKGLAVFSFTGIDPKIAEFYNPAYKYIIPIHCGQTLVFHIWAMPHPEGKVKSYVGQIWAALQYYESYISGNVILAGDFNSHVKWDAERSKGNHSDVVKFLADRQILSVYHEVNQIKPGEEPDPTIYLLKQKHKPYHLDYCFASQTCVSDQTTAEIGRFEDWIGESDHMPLVVDKLLIK